MADEKPLPFAGTDEELEKYLVEFAGFVGGWTARNTRDSTWRLSAGAPLSTNPNTFPWTIRIARREGGLSLERMVRTLPWTRAKARRIAEYREGQLADYLTARVRGSGPEKFDATRLREPFTPFGSGVAAVTSSFAWAVLTGLAVFAAAFLSTTIASVPFMSRTIREIGDHSALLKEAGAIPLPSPDEARETSALGAAAVFAAPVAFFAAFVHAAALVACDLFRRTARLPLASFFFLGALVMAAFWPFLSLWAAPLGILVPAGAHLGATAVWGRRRERVRDGPRPAKAVVVIAALLSASLAGAAVPKAASWKESLLRIVLFRDAWLLGNGPGRSIAATYYRYTLYTAEPLKQVFSADERRPSRQQPIAVCADPAIAAQLRRLDFAVVAPPGRGDVAVGPGGVDPGRSPDELKVNLDRASAASFRGGSLRDLCWASWRAVYYAGPLAVLLVMMGIVSPFVSILFRKLPPKIATIALAAIGMLSSLLIVFAAEGERPAAKPADLAEDLTDYRTSVRHEAAVRAFQLDSTAEMAEALLKAADDRDFRVRLWVCGALGKSRDPRALAKLVERLDDPEFLVRYRAAQGLEYLGDARAVEPLLRMMRERSWYEGMYALDALRRIRPGQF